MMRNNCVRLLVALALSLWAGLTADAQYGLTAGAGAGSPGDTVDISIELDADEASLGFSLGLAHDDALLSLDGLIAGDAISDSNDGDGPDFFVTDTDPEGGSGGTVLCILENEGNEEIPAEDGLEIVVFQYTILTDADAGALATLDFTSDLGSPSVSTVVSDGSSYFPTLTSGSIAIDVPPIEDLSCTFPDPCICEVAIAWDNPTDYDEIDVFVDGDLEETLDGTDTTYVVTLDGDEALISVIGRSNDVDGSTVSCTAICPDVPLAMSPTDITCSVNTITCTVNLSWINPQTFGALDISLDGEIEETLGGSATTASVELPDDDEIHTLTIGGTNLCGIPFTAVTCDVECDENAPIFLRGDSNNNGDVFGIVDALFILQFGFAGGDEPECYDAADVDDSGDIFAILDGLFLLQYALAGGTVPAAPGPDSCGADATVDDLDCATPECP